MIPLLASHWVCSEFERMLLVLRCLRYNTVHSADIIAKTLKGIAFDWGILKIHAVIRDMPQIWLMLQKMRILKAIDVFATFYI